MKFCKECGTQLADDAVFCKECGTPCGPVPAAPAAPVEPEAPAPRFDLDAFKAEMDSFSNQMLACFKTGADSLKKEADEATAMADLAKADLKKAENDFAARLAAKENEFAQALAAKEQEMAAALQNKDQELAASAEALSTLRLQYDAIMGSLTDSRRTLNGLETEKAEAATALQNALDENNRLQDVIAGLKAELAAAAAAATAAVAAPIAEAVEELKEEAPAAEEAVVEAVEEAVETVEEVKEEIAEAVEEAAAPVAEAVETVADAPVARFCPNCGAPTNPEMVFCGGCGYKLK